MKSYYGRPVLKPPVWKWEIPAYLFAGGMAGASATLSLAAAVTGHCALARRAGAVAAAGAAVSPALLVADLGRPARFLNMLRVAKPTSPMSMGTWVLSGFVPCALGAAACDALDALPRTRSALRGVAGGLGPVMATYTAVLVADTAIPAWHEARHDLPFVFAGGAGASAGAAVLLLMPGDDGRPARRLALFGAALSLVAVERMQRRLGQLAEPYRSGSAAAPARAAKALIAAGAALIAVAGGGRRPVSMAGAVLLLSGAGLERFAVIRAGRDSALDPAATIRPQRERL